MPQLEINLLVEASSGGAGRHTIDLFHGLRSRGWPVKLILSPLRVDSSTRADIERVGAEHIIFLPMQRSPHWRDLLVLRALRGYLKGSRKRHVLHAHSTKAGFIGAALKPWLYKSVLTPHAFRGMDPTLPAWKCGSIQKAEWAFSRRYDLVIGVSEAECAYAVRLGLAPERVRHIPNGIDSERIAVAATRAATSSVRAPTVGFIGRLTYQKNPELFLDTFALISEHLQNAKALIIGDGPLLDTLKAQAEALGISSRVEWVGAVSAIEHLGRMDVLVHTSRYESQPYALLEAAAASVPVVSVRNQGSVAIFGDVSGNCLVESATATELAATTIKLLTNPAIHQQCVQNGLLIANRLSVNAMLEKITQEYSLLL